MFYKIYINLFIDVAHLNTCVKYMYFHVVFSFVIRHRRISQTVWMFPDTESFPVPPDCKTIASHVPKCPFHPNPLPPSPEIDQTRLTSCPYCAKHVHPIFNKPSTPIPTTSLTPSNYIHAMLPLGPNRRAILAKNLPQSVKIQHHAQTRPPNCWTWLELGHPAPCKVSLSGLYSTESIKNQTNPAVGVWMVLGWLGL